MNYQNSILKKDNTIIKLENIVMKANYVLTMKQIADRLDTTKPPLRQVLKEVGISLPRGRRKKSHKFKGEI